MPCRYPVILVHGIAAKQLRVFNAFGRIGHKLAESGERVYIADTDGFGTIEGNAEQLRAFVLRVLEACEVDKVNIIAHSKGGLDAKYMITHLGMEEHVASLTTLCTPHRGSIIASRIWQLPQWIKRTCAFFIDTTYRLLLRDKAPNSMRACEQLLYRHEDDETVAFSHAVYAQSYSSTLHRGKDCFLMSIPRYLYKKYEDIDNDGLVCSHSARFAHYRGECLDISVSHVQIIDLFAKRSQREKIYAFYLGICRELSEMGF